MEQRSQEREVRLVDPAWSVSELMARIAKALVSDGPALALTPISQSSVNSRIALICSTTGSSGTAKEVGLAATSLLASAKASNAFLGATFGSTWSLLLPLNHIAGINVLIRSLELGTTPTSLIGYEGKYPRVDFTAIVPTQLFRALNGDEYLREHLQGAKAVLVGGAALSQELRGAAESAGINLIETYGSTETSGGCIYNGKPLHGVDVKIDESMRISIKGNVLAYSYLNPDLQLTDNEGWYRTSDCGRIVDGKVIVDGRADDVVITGGENISLSAIERVISGEFPESQSAAFALPDSEWGQAIHLAVVGLSEANNSRIQELLTKAIAPAAKAKAIHHLQELPLIGIGKVDREELVRRFQ